MHELTALPWFYLECLRGDPLRLAGDEAHHVRTTRRLVPGDAVVLFDGVGHVARGTIRGAARDEIEVAVDSRHTCTAPAGGLTLAVALPKAKRQDLVFEKLTELSARAIWPMQTRRSVARPDASRVAKWRRISIEAAKQSRQPFLPDVRPTQSFDAILRAFGRFDLVLLACLADDAAALRGVLDAVAPPLAVLALVGPEGGFTEDEMQQARDAGAKPVRLAPGVLRVETAAISLAAAFNVWSSEPAGECVGKAISRQQDA